MQAIQKAMRQSGLAQLRLVPEGQRTSLEHVIEETRSSAKWAGYYQGFVRSYLHLTAALGMTSWRLANPQNMSSHTKNNLTR